VEYTDIINGYGHVASHQSHLCRVALSLAPIFASATSASSERLKNLLGDTTASQHNAIDSWATRASEAQSHALFVRTTRSTQRMIRGWNRSLERRLGRRRRYGRVVLDQDGARAAAVVVLHRRPPALVRVQVLEIPEEVIPQPAHYGHGDEDGEEGSQELGPAVAVVPQVVRLPQIEIPIVPVLGIVIPREA